MTPSTLTVLRRVLLFVLVALCGALVGVTLSYYPTMRDDLYFLHSARLAAEYQMLLQRQQQQQQQQPNAPIVASPGTIAPSKPIEPPPKDKGK